LALPSAILPQSIARDAALNPFLKPDRPAMTTHRSTAAKTVGKGDDEDQHGGRSTGLDTVRDR